MIQMRDEYKQGIQKSENCMVSFLLWYSSLPVSAAMRETISEYSPTIQAAALSTLGNEVLIR